MLKLNQSKKKWAYVLLTFSLLFQMSCASTNKGKILETVAVSAAAGVVYGQTRPEFKAQNSLMYGSVVGLTGALIGLYVFDEEKKSQELRVKVSKLEEELQGFNRPSSQTTDLNFSNPTNPSPAPQALRSQLKNFLPKKIQKLVRPGEWAFYSIDEWEQLDDTKMIHKDQILEFKPPELVVPTSN